LNCIARLNSALIDLANHQGSALYFILPRLFGEIVMNIRYSIGLMHRLAGLRHFAALSFLAVQLNADDSLYGYRYALRTSSSANYLSSGSFGL